jgi:hypothetical protein
MSRREGHRVVAAGKEAMCGHSNFMLWGRCGAGLHLHPASYQLL